nr:E3 ubiquitin-protein ligase [Piper nigrum]
MEDVEIPSFFICPISLEIMGDPVTVSTGITYDRESIESWIYSGKNKTCPVTRQPLQADLDLTPNHTLRRLIQSWCTIHASIGVERIPTPRPPLDRTQIVKLIDEARRAPMSTMINSLGKLKEMASESERNKRCMEAAGASHFLADVVRKAYSSTATATALIEDSTVDWLKAGDEAITILHSILCTEEGIRELITGNCDLIHMLTQVLRRGDYQSRTYAVLLLRDIFEEQTPENLLGIKLEVFMEMVRAIKDEISKQVTKAALQILIRLCPWGRNSVRAAEAGSVPVLVELLLDSSEKRMCEMILMALDLLCRCADGRAELLRHAAGLAVVSKKMMRVSFVGTERVVRIVYSIAKSSTSASVLQEMLQVGVVGKLCMVLQTDCNQKMKNKIREILCLHSKLWSSSPCLPHYFQVSYPSHL